MNYEYQRMEHQPPDGYTYYGIEDGQAVFIKDVLDPHHGGASHSTLEYVDIPPDIADRVVGRELGCHHEGCHPEHWGDWFWKLSPAASVDKENSNG